MNHAHAEKIVYEALAHYQRKADNYASNATFGRVECTMSYRKSTVGGRAYLSELFRYGQYRIMLNIPLHAVNDDEYKIYETVGHEVAHLVACKIHGDRGHGRMWKNVMVAFGLEPKRCHTMDDAAATVGKNTTVYVYRCTACGTYSHVGAKRHKNQQRWMDIGARGYYHCRGGELQFITQTDKRTFVQFKNGEISQLPVGRQDRPQVQTPIGAAVAAPASAPAKKRKRSGPSKIDQARAIYKTMSNGNRTRKETIGRFVNEIGMTPAGAATYYAKIKKENS